MSIVPTELSESLGKTISDLCPFSIAQDNGVNHCAHYVSHMMGYELPGATCRNYTWDDREMGRAEEIKGANIRVDEVFNRLQRTGPWTDKPDNLRECLIFVTRAYNMRTDGDKLIMGDHPYKHIGILTNGYVWHYSNSNNKVVSHPLVHFKNTFRNAYATSGTTVEFYYGKFL